MTLVEIILLGVALSMDAFAVTVSNMFAYKNISTRRAMLQPLFFGGFQFLMPVIGFFAGSLVADFISQYAGIITLVILGYIGGKMVWDGLHPEAEEDQAEDGKVLSLSTLFFQGIATAIDALAVGVSFAALAVDAIPASAVIGVTTFLLTIVAMTIGRQFGHKLGDKATIVGGVVLICIGLKAMFL